MSLTGLILSLALTVGVLLVILYPLATRHRDTLSARVDKQRERALAYYERVLTNVRDLDEDHVTGKIAADEYQTERDYWVNRGVAVLRLLDELDEQHLITEAPNAEAADVDAAIEAAIQRHRKSQPQASTD